MATVSGGSKPTFTADQVLHAVEMNQLNQEWIVDSVPAGSAGKNGDVVFVTNKGGVWAKVSGSWVQASLTSADMQTLQDQIDSIQSSGYDDTQLRADFAAADATTLASANTYTDDEVAKIVVPDVSDLATKDELTTGLAGKADEPHTHDTTHNHNGVYSLTTHLHDDNYAEKTHTHDTTHNHDTEYQPVGDYATNSDLTDGLATKSDTDHVHIQTGSGLTFDPSREGQIVQSTNGTDWTAGMSLRVVTSVPDDTEGEIGDIVFVVGS